MWLRTRHPWGWGSDGKVHVELDLIATNVLFVAGHMPVTASSLAS
jgi:hypothetical protein